VGRIDLSIEEQPATEARYAEGASETALLIPKPPEFTGREACSHD
jgi:hypothetical protein